MKVRIISSTKPEEDLISEGINTPKELVAFCARVSNPANQYNNETVDRLLGYLIKHKHWSPLEMVDVTIEISTTRDIARQILRHRSFSFQEFSQRYADPTQSAEFETREARLQDSKNRQNSIEVIDNKLQEDWGDIQDSIIDKATKAYEWAISQGIAKEVARAVLPEGLTSTRLYMKGSLRSWVTYIALREKNGTQKEHQLIAKECKKIICNLFPTLITVLGDVSEDWIV